MVKTKSVFLLCVILGVMFMLASCEKSTSVKSSNDTSPIVEPIDFNSCYFVEDAVYRGDIIQNANAAKSYANIVMTEIDQDLQQYKNVTVSYDSKNSIWVINYGIDDETVGGDVSIAISKKTGEIKRIWFGE